MDDRMCASKCAAGCRDDLLVAPDVTLEPLPADSNLLGRADKADLQLERQTHFSIGVANPTLQSVPEANFNKHIKIH
ncbi:Hypothetical predicted protein [Cloeon dipterum]|uniref:Uncharacterized protein n=1 Tax=Cloeon dipterum TaxID=197152 RepID=A0A8S1E0R6_9INSE|nr:Hypothetical predicted protein [Cloeon dipterum]